MLAMNPTLLVGPSDWDAARMPEAEFTARESFITIHLDPIDEAACADLVTALGDVFSEVRLAVQYWRPMLDRVNEAQASAA